VHTGDVLFATVRPYLRNIAAVPSNYDGEIASTGFSVLRPAKGIEPNFLFYNCIYAEFVDALSGAQYGVSYPAVKDEQVRAQYISLPPFKEQHRIVAKIEELFSELDKGIESLKTAREQLKIYRHSLLKHAFEGNLTAHWKAAAIEAGALGSSISGSGPTAFALARGRESAERVARAMAAAYRARGAGCTVRVGPVDRNGATVTREGRSG
jgi:hypothetical protein